MNINRFDPLINQLLANRGPGGPGGAGAGGFGMPVGMGGMDPQMHMVHMLKHMLHNVEHQIVQQLMSGGLGQAGGAAQDPMSQLMAQLGGGNPMSQLGGGNPMSQLGGGALADPLLAQMGGGLPQGTDSFGLGADPFGGQLGGLTGGLQGLPGLSGGLPAADPLSDLMQAIPPPFDPTQLAQGACFPQSFPGAFPGAAPCGCAAAAPPPCAAAAAPPPPPPPPPQLTGSEPGGWLIKHGEYKKNDDGTWDITGGQYQGCKAVPVPNQKGSFTINNGQGQPVGTYAAPNNADKIASPLTFDINGTGKVGTTDMAHGRNFRMGPDGQVTAWPAPGEAMLAFGAGNSGATLFGNNTQIDGKKFNNGFQALKALADKYLGPQRTAKGYLDKTDLQELEQKANLHMLVAGNGPGQDRKARPVEDLGIDQISLQYNEAGANADENGNQHREVGAGFVQNGQKKRVDDVWYKYR